MINPELIVGMLFMAAMKKNEAIEILGVERFSCYMGYGSSFRFTGDYLDKKPLDSRGRRKTKIVAIDALSNAMIRQFEVECLIRETNKAFCGFFDPSKNKCYLKNFQEAFFKEHFDGEDNEAIDMSHNNCSVNNATSAQAESPLVSSPSMDCDTSTLGFNGHLTNEICQNETGIATGNWGCGAFGGDLELKTIIQWLAASQALRPFIHYYTFGDAALQRLEQQVSQWILLHRWTVGDLWNILVEYSSQRLKGKTNVGFFNWLLPQQAYSSDDHYMSE
ncbi:poly(ADP-ribose) glycohydrolase 1-like isoform X1 [Asparagus officinalis]|uniref:poly(ADP-ribose) glycohydrolase 1-like isoform X1 n=1 Tax=Asparagus officinalis TaxID=4686 RepID=UPI00098E7627|nr:poly(ADP-ribose) glycohydrolase 1-like isoform X1 [Asparagus officinalis]